MTVYNYTSGTWATREIAESPARLTWANIEASIIGWWYKLLSIIVDNYSMACLRVKLSCKAERINVKLNSASRKTMRGDLINAGCEWKLKFCRETKTWIFGAWKEKFNRSINDQQTLEQKRLWILRVSSSKFMELQSKHLRLLLDNYVNSLASIVQVKWNFFLLAFISYFRMAPLTDFQHSHRIASNLFMFVLLFHVFC